jgi:hypothetical protein
MKLLSSLILAACIVSGCMTSNNVAHDDGEAGTGRAHDGGPTLCRDGTPPPCTIRE